jgi:hypothetical protein
VIVLFDGTANRPYGKMLFSEQSVTVAPPPAPEPLIRREYRTVVTQVRALKASCGSQWYTAAEFGSMCGLDRERMSRVIAGLIKRGEMRPERKRPMRSGAYKEQQRYQFLLGANAAAGETGQLSQSQELDKFGSEGRGHETQ